MSTLFTLPRQVPVDSSGQPYAGAKLYFYAEGTTTAQAVYQDEALATPHAQPVVADANGRFAIIYLNPSAAGDYRVQLKTSADALIYDQDNVPKSGISAATVGAALYPRTQAEIDAGVTPTNYQHKPGNVMRYGAVGDGVTDDSVAFAKAIKYASTPVATTYSSSWHIPDGRFVVSENNFIGANLVISQSLYGGRFDLTCTGNGRNTSVIIFKPTASGAYCYDQSATPTKLLNGCKFHQVGFLFDNSANGSNPIHFMKPESTASAASQKFRFDEFAAQGVSGSVFIELTGAVNEDMISGKNVLLRSFAQVIKSNVNSEAVLHHFYNLDLLLHTGDAFEYSKGGQLKVWGLNAYMSGNGATVTSLLKTGDGTTGQIYSFDNARIELHSEGGRALNVPLAAENTIKFTNCRVMQQAGNYPWAQAVVQHHATIIFRDCILPARAGVADEGTFRLIDSTSGSDYAATNQSHSYIRFENCDNVGSRLQDVDGWVDYSYLTGASANYRSCQVVYRGCGNLPDSVEYGYDYRLGRTFVPSAPPKLIFRGTTFPYGNGASAAVVSAADLNAVVPLNCFVTEIVVMRSALTGATTYQIEFIDQAERTSPGSGVIFGSTTAQANNVAIAERVKILRRFTGTRAQRTIWCRMAQGYTLTAGQTGVPTDGGIYAEVL